MLLFGMIIVLVEDLLSSSALHFCFSLIQEKTGCKLWSVGSMCVALVGGAQEENF